MLRISAAALAVALLATPLAFGLGLEDVASVIDETAGADQWVVGFFEMPDIKEGDLYMGERVVSVTPELAFITVKTLNFASFELRAQMDENVRYIETDVSDHQLHYSPNDYFVAHSSNYGMNKIGLPTAWDRTLGATSIKEGHLDSGIKRGHEDFQPTTRFLAGKNYYQTSQTHTNDESGCSWHGSHTTGTVAASINNGKGFPGTAQITVIPVKIFGGSQCFAASVTNLANALKYVGDQGAQISSNSWGGGSYSTAINDAITYSYNKGVIFVASSGNGGCNNCVGNPWVAQEAKVIIVTATDANDAAYTMNSKGWQTDISAPGVSTGSAGGPNTNSYYLMTGTSMAAPYVAGVAALIKTLNPSFTFTQMESRLKSTSVDLGAAGEDDTFGAGRVNAAAAVY